MELKLWYLILRIIKKSELETWVDTVNQGKGPYKKVDELIDKGKWGKFMKICGANKKGDIISWGSPDIVIKTNDNVFDIYDIEVREIIPPKFKFIDKIIQIAI